MKNINRDRFLKLTTTSQINKKWNKFQEWWNTKISKNMNCKWKCWNKNKSSFRKKWRIMDNLQQIQMIWMTLVILKEIIRIMENLTNTKIILIIKKQKNNSKMEMVFMKMNLPLRMYQKWMNQKKTLKWKPKLIFKKYFLLIQILTHLGTNNLNHN